MYFIVLVAEGVAEGVEKAENQLESAIFAFKQLKKPSKCLFQC